MEGSVSLCSRNTCTRERRRSEKPKPHCRFAHILQELRDELAAVNVWVLLHCSIEILPVKEIGQIHTAGVKAKKGRERGGPRSEARRCSHCQQEASSRSLFCPFPAAPAAVLLLTMDAPCSDSLSILVRDEACVDKRPAMDIGNDQDRLVGRLGAGNVGVEVAQLALLAHWIPLVV